MTVPAPIILTVALSMPQHHADRHETDEQRAELLWPFAVAISRNVRSLDEAAYSLSQAHHESGGFARYVLENRCTDGPRGAQCDPDRDGVPRAIGPLQVWPRWCPDADTLDGQVRCSLKMARLGLARCRTWEGAFAAQLGSGACTAPRSAARVSTMRVVLRKLQREQWEASR